jgi:hypothetical protein
MLAQVNLLSLLLSPVLFYVAGAMLFIVLNHFNIIKTEA